MYLQHLTASFTKTGITDLHFAADSPVPRLFVLHAVILLHQGLQCHHVGVWNCFGGQRNLICLSCSLSSAVIRIA